VAEASKVVASVGVMLCWGLHSRCHAVGRLQPFGHHQ